MGYWAETCFFSNLPIEEDEEVVVFLLRTKPKQFYDLGDSMSYVDDLLLPISLGLKGYYDGYGRIELDSKLSDYHSAVIQNMYNRNGGLKYSSTGDVLEAFNEGVIVGNPYNYTKVFMKKNVYDKVIEMAKDEIQPPFSLTYKKEFKYSSYFEYLKDTATNYFKELESSETVDQPLFLREDPDVFQDEPDVLDKFTRMLAISKNPSELLIDSFCEFILLNSVLSESRKAWVMPSGSGSQSINLSIATRLNTVLTDALKEDVESKYARLIKDNHDGSENGGSGLDYLKEDNPELYETYLKSLKGDFVAKARLVSTEH